LALSGLANVATTKPTVSGSVNNSKIMSKPLMKETKFTLHSTIQSMNGLNRGIRWEKRAEALDLQCIKGILSNLITST